jgi:hypothetical protein
MLAACSNDEENVAPKDDYSLEVDLASLQSNVPITFGTVYGDAYVTRGAIVSFENTVPDMGVFCIASHTILTGTTENRGINWSGATSVPLYNLLGVWQKNVKAHIVNAIGETGKLVWDDPSETHFYPNKDWYGYDFVSYHPWTDSICYYPSYIEAFITVDGNDDVFIGLGQRTGVDHEYAFSRFYFQDIPGSAVPTFNYEQMVAKLNFNFKLKQSTDKVIYVDSLVIEDYPNVMRLRISQIVNSQFLYQPDRTGLATTSTGNLWMRNADDTSISGNTYQNPETGELDYRYRLSTTPVTVGGGLLIPPVSGTHSKRNLQLKVFIKDDSGNVYTTNEAVTVTAPSGGWQKAKEYNINVSLSAPTLIESYARITGWDSDVTEVNCSD